MKPKDAPTRQWKKPGRQRRLRSRGKSHVTISALAAMLLSVVCVTMFCANTVSSQNLRRRMRIQKKIEQKAPRPPDNSNKLTPSDGGKEELDTSDQPEAMAPRAATQPNGHNLEGIRQRGFPSLFAQEEASLWIPGFGNRATLLMIFRQLDLTPEQKGKIRDLRRQIGNRLAVARRDLNQLEAQLTEAIYGNIDPASLDKYDPAKVKELTEQVVTKRGDVFRLQTDIESQFRQILTPDQFYVFRELVLDMVLPGRRNPGRQQRQQQRRNGIQPNLQNRPNQQDQED
ncbi:MAG TPA: Spy/CpxP family protein refolding chaperone [Blastocatellia bacterium]|jgi:Spy/CpxP family protein refolding chaperone|nr:Spy/CpxP family protein refolding chaperone [Blastocatellia bacterium]